jgi:uncharacterized RDD family membrane protein YckC
MENLYAPPVSNLNESADIGPDASLQYAGFWRRLLAALVDCLVFLPLLLIVFVLGSHYRLFLLYWAVPSLAISLGYRVYLVYRYGGTPGQRLMGVKIALCDEAAVTPKAAMLRFSVEFCLGALLQLAWIIAVLRMPNDLFHALEASVREQRLAALLPGWYRLAHSLSLIWAMSEFVVMLTNRKRRGLQDFLAGTVVIRY